MAVFTISKLKGLFPKLDKALLSKKSIFKLRVGPLVNFHMVRVRRMDRSTFDRTPRLLDQVHPMPLSELKCSKYFEHFNSFTRVKEFIYAVKLK